MISFPNPDLPAGAFLLVAADAAASGLYPSGYTASRNSLPTSFLANWVLILSTGGSVVSSPKKKKRGCEVDQIENIGAKYFTQNYLTHDHIVSGQGQAFDERVVRLEVGIFKSLRMVRLHFQFVDHFLGRRQLLRLGFGELHGGNISFRGKRARQKK